MKTKQLFAGFRKSSFILAIGVLFVFGSNIHAQTAVIGPNQYAFQFSNNNNYGLFFNAGTQRYDFRNGSGDPVFSFDANNGRMATNLEFLSGTDYLVPNDRYAFRAKSNPNYGLFFNASSLSFDFRNGSAVSVASISANTGNLNLNGGVKVGNVSTGTPGTIRWNGSDLQGYNGSNWVSLTGGNIPGPQGPEGPQGPSGLLPNGSIHAIPYWNGSTWDVTNTQGLRSNGTSAALGTGPSATRRFYVVNPSPSVAAPGHSVIRADRNGSNNNSLAGTSWNLSQADAAVTGFVDYGNSYSAAIYGTSYLDFENSAAVLGTVSGGNIFGALGYKAPNSGGFKAGYFEGDVEITRTVGNANLRLSGDGNAQPGIDFFRQGFASNDWRIATQSGILMMSRSANDLSTFDDALRISAIYTAPGINGNASLGFSFYRWSAVFANNGTINTSDAREKTNVQDLGYGLNEIMRLRPVSFDWINNPDDGKKLGLIAQDLQKVLPEVVRDWDYIETEEGGVQKVEAERLGVFYSDIIPVIIKGMQEQQVQIEKFDPEALLTREEGEAIKAENAALKEKYTALENQIAQLVSRLNSFDKDLESCCMSQSNGQLHDNNGSGVLSTDDLPFLGQNVPNPFRESTLIQYYLPENVVDAMIRISTLDGRPVKDLKLGNRQGHNEVELYTNGLTAGTYLYTLFVDGQLLATKKMMLVR